MANIAEQHEVWDFLSASSKVSLIMRFGVTRAITCKVSFETELLYSPFSGINYVFSVDFSLQNYSFGKSSSVMKTLAGMHLVLFNTWS